MAQHGVTFRRVELTDIMDTSSSPSSCPLIEEQVGLGNIDCERPLGEVLHCQAHNWFDKLNVTCRKSKVIQEDGEAIMSGGRPSMCLRIFAAQLVDQRTAQLTANGHPCGIPRLGASTSDMELRTWKRLL